MLYNYAVRITRSYELCKHIVAAWALRCDKILAYEHVGTVTEKVHIHLIIVGSSVSSEQLKNIAKPLGGATLKGNADWSFKTKDAKYGEVTDSPRYISYMSKGEYDPKYNKGYSDAELAEAKSAYVPMGKMSARLREYLEFEKQMNIKHPALSTTSVLMGQTLVYPAFQVIKDEAFKCAFAKSQLLCYQTSCNAKTYTLTYCYKKGIEVDPKYCWK